MIRTTRPTSNNKYFIRQANGGYSTCIQGKPTDSQCNVLSNCVGYACGAFNEELALGYEKYHLNCNAENFIERAIASGLSVYKNAHVGDIICWEGVGSLAGHVGIVTEVVNSNCIKVAQSGYGNSNPFWVATHYNNNGNWGLNSNYKIRGFIENPNYKHNSNPTPETPSSPTKSLDEIAKDVIAGKYGNYPERKTKLESEGYNYSQVQNRVNEMLAGAKPSSNPSPNPNPVEDDLLMLVKKTIRGDFGNGNTRKEKLGTKYSEVQHQVDLNIKHGTTRWDNIKLY